MGLGVPETAPIPPEGPVGCRYINPATKDFEVDPDTGQLKQMPPERQQVLLALMTLARSSTAPELRNFGITMPRKMGDNFQASMVSAVRTALRDLTDRQKVIRIDSVKVEKGAGGRARTTVTYTITRTGKPDAPLTL